jgi:hypothetical protein
MAALDGELKDRRGAAAGVRAAKSPQDFAQTQQLLIGVRSIGPARHLAIAASLIRIRAVPASRQ